MGRHLSNKWINLLKHFATSWLHCMLNQKKLQHVTIDINKSWLLSVNLLFVTNGCVTTFLLNLKLFCVN